VDIARPQSKRAIQGHLEKESGERNMEVGFRYSWKRWIWQQKVELDGSV